jgi:hypothetical protein
MGASNLHIIMTLPPKLSTRGGGSVGVSAEIWNQLIDYLRSTRVLPNIHIRPLVTSQGTILATIDRSSKIPAPPDPWDIIELIGQGTPDDKGIFSTYKARVSPGLLCGILPSNWDEEFSFSGTGLVYAVAKIQTDGTAINSVEIKISGTAPTNQTPEKWKLPSSVEYLFALINKGEVKRVIGAGHITIGPKIWITVPKAQAVGPGEIAYDRYYILS